MCSISRRILSSRLSGSLYGLAVGDALGAPYEFEPRGSYQISTTMKPTIGKFRVNLPAGAFTDDTRFDLVLL
jgi:ADP-ribosyl-[dinitrogen reductase] hydrolase